MLIEYIYGIIFFVMPIVGMFVAVIVAGIKNIRVEGSECLNTDIKDIPLIKDGKHICDKLEESIVADIKPATIINMTDWVKSRAMHKLANTVTNQVVISRCVGDSRGYVDYGLASDILTTRRKKELCNWLKQNQDKEKAKKKEKHEFRFIKRYKFRRQNIRAGP